MRRRRSGVRRRSGLRSQLWEQTRTTSRKCTRLRHSWRAFVRRGDVHELRLPKGVGHEQRGLRYGVIVQADTLLPRSVVLMAPTSTRARPATFRPELAIGGETTRVLVEQVGAVHVNRLGDLVRHASIEELWGIDESLMTVLGLS
ncbi:MAG: type II toxin-antitoxin system PemK/MazF family toxin [Acidimicrobiales bacterium]|nr:type II toxin-antitoxin system PemK/MazF family toxin [Acidimicrobiales bacterium]